LPFDIQEPEHDLLQRIARGDGAAFALLFSRYSDWVYATSLRLTRSGELAEEIVQDVFLKIWLKREGLMAIESFSDYLFTIARNQSFTVLKRMLRLQSIGRLPEDAVLADNGTDAAILYKDFESVLQAAISRLPRRQNQVYRLIRLQGLKREEAAARLGISPHTVKIHLREALLSVRAYCLAHLDLLGIFLFLFLH